jgi:hypothetical protein
MSRNARGRSTGPGGLGWSGGFVDLRIEWVVGAALT